MPPANDNRSELVAALYEVHAGICEQNARVRRQKRRGL